jgi:hypothetical protein
MSIVNVHAPVPAQASLHPAKMEPRAGVAASVTPVPLAKDAEQVSPQSIPAGLLVTEPGAGFPIAHCGGTLGWHKALERLLLLRFMPRCALFTDRLAIGLSFVFSDRPLQEELDLLIHRSVLAKSHLCQPGFQISGNAD